MTMGSAQKAAEAARPRERRVEALERELREFAYIVSHDLAACFRHVKAFSELLEQDSTGFSPEQNSYCGHIRTAADNCAAMLEQLLVFSRVQRRPMEPVETGLCALLDSARLQLGAEIRRSGARILGGEGGAVRVDRELFVLALKCLLDNAIKFRRAGAAPRVTIDTARDFAGTRIRIADDGIGLPPMDPERLFGMFTRGDPQAFPGIGSGLAIARRIVRRHGGDLCFVAARQGACAEIRLPGDGREG
jgi:signal transduction histidine kinase